MNEADTIKHEADRIVREHILNWPSIIPTRGAFLDQMFYTIGNGYDWLDGQLVDVTGDPRVQQDMSNEHFERAEAEENPAMREMLLKLASERQQEADTVRNEVDERVRRTDIPSGTYYQENEYSRIRSVPDDVTDVWRALADEAAQLHAQYIADPNMVDRVEKQKQRHKNLHL